MDERKRVGEFGVEKRKNENKVEINHSSNFNWGTIFLDKMPREIEKKFLPGVHENKIFLASYRSNISSVRMWLVEYDFGRSCVDLGPHNENFHHD